MSIQNGDVDIIDALFIAQYYVGLNPSYFDSTVADVNGDNSIDILDALRVGQFYVGIVSILSCLTGITPNPTGVCDPVPGFQSSGRAVTVPCVLATFVASEKPVIRFFAPGN